MRAAVLAAASALVVGFWIATSVLAVQDGFTFLKDTSFDIVAPAGSQTLAGEHTIAAAFITVQDEFELDSAIVFVATRTDDAPCRGEVAGSDDPALVDTPELDRFLTALASWLYTNNDCDGGSGKQATTRYHNATRSCYFRRLSTSQRDGGYALDSYATRAGDRDATIARLEARSWRAYPNPNVRPSPACATSFAIERSLGYGNDAHAYPAFDRIFPWVQAHAPAGWTVHAGGTRQGLRAAREGAIRDMAAGEPFTLPLAFFVLACAIGPLALLVLLTLPAAGLGVMLVLSDWHVLAFLGMRVEDSLVRRFAFASFTPPIGA